MSDGEEEKGRRRKTRVTAEGGGKVKKPAVHGEESF